MLLGLLAVGVYAPLAACGADDTPAKTLPDASHDSTQSDAVVTFDTTQPDVADASIADTSVPDTSDAADSAVAADASGDAPDAG